MIRRVLYLLATIAIAASTSARAGTLSISLKDTHGAAASDAIVTLVPVSGSIGASRVPEEAVIGQKNQMFSQLAVVVRTGGRVVFTNNDDTMHQVYSFSTIKRFEQEIEKGRRSQPVVFDKPGVAAIGCNIHDNMIAYVYVTDAPLAVRTDAKGVAQIADLPAGTYHAVIWHPRLLPGQSPSADVVVTESGATLTRALTLMADKTSNSHKQHMQSY